MVVVVVVFKHTHANSQCCVQVVLEVRWAHCRAHILSEPTPGATQLINERPLTDMLLKR